MPPKGSKKGVASKETSAKKTATSKQSSAVEVNAVSEVTSAKKTATSRKSTTTAVNSCSNNNIGTLSIFPAEIVLNVFSHLDYHDVKCCLMVCKGFRAYCDHPTLDKFMYRNIAPLAACVKFKPNEVRLHPCIDGMSYECSTDINDAYMMSYKEVDSVYSDHGTYPLVKTSAINEYATMPAMKAIKIKIQSKKPIEIKNDNGVTIHDVLKALVAFFSVVQPGVMLYDVCPWLNGSDPYFLKMNKIENRKATRRDMMGDHTGWAGFDRRSFDKSGVLMLVVEGFDS